MLANPWVGIAAIVVVGLIVCFALWRGRGADVSLGAGGLRLRTPQPESKDSISVAQAADIGGEVGSIAGRVGSSGSRAPHAGDIGVANEMIVRPGAKVGEITGERLDANRAAAPNRK